jgi:hypothetical protein
MKPKNLVSSLASAASAVGKGAVAGVAATAAMTVSSSLEMKMAGREASDAPSSAAGKVLGVQPRNPEGAKRFNNFVHWSYGTAWGSIGAMWRLALPDPYATAAHFASVWGIEVVMLPSLEVAPPVKKWGAREIAIDIFHHVVYVAAFAGVWRLLNNDSGSSKALVRRTPLIGR